MEDIEIVQSTAARLKGELFVPRCPYASAIYNQADQSWSEVFPFKCNNTHESDPDFVMTLDFNVDRGFLALPEGLSVSEWLGKTCLCLMFFGQKLNFMKVTFAEIREVPDNLKDWRIHLGVDEVMEKEHFLSLWKMMTD